MAITILNVEGTQVVFGATWVPLVGDSSEKAEALRLAKRFNAFRGLRVANNESIFYGVLSKEELSDADVIALKKNKSYCVSALLANTEHVSQDAIWLEVDGSVAKLAAIKNGMPVAGGEFVGSFDFAKGLIEQIRTDNPGVSFTMYGNCDVLFPSNIPLAITDLLEAKEAKNVSFGPMSQADHRRTYFLLAILAAIVLHHSWPKIHAWIGPKRIQKVAVAAEDPNVVYWRYVESVLKQNVVPLPAVRDFIAGNTQQDTLKAGFVEVGQTCTVQYCKYDWRPLGGDYATFVAAMGPRKYIFDSSESMISYTDDNPAPGRQRLDAHALPTYDQFMLTGGALLQRLKLVGAQSPSITPPTPFGTEITKTAVGASVDISKLKSVVMSGTFQTGGPAALLFDALDGLPNNVSIEKVDISIGESSKLNPTFTLTGTYYVKN